MALKKTIHDLADELRPSVNEIDTMQLAELIAADKVVPRPDVDPGGNKAVLIDVREPSEREDGYIPGSSHLPRGILERDVEAAIFGGQVSDADLNRPIICYCRGGHRSIMTAHALQQMGFTDVTSVSGGYREWTECGRPVERSSG